MGKNKIHFILKNLLSDLLGKARFIRDCIYPVRCIGKNNLLSISCNLSRRSKFLLIGDGNKIDISSSCIIEHTNIQIFGNNNVLCIEEGFCIRKGQIQIVGNGCTIVIKKKTTIKEADIFVAENQMKIVIGEDCMFSTAIHIRTSDGHPIYGINGERLNHAKNIVIGNHVWIARNVSILKGANIGNNAIIGLGSVVTHHIPANTIAVGVPAKVIRENVRWERKFS